MHLTDTAPRATTPLPRGSPTTPLMHPPKSHLFILHPASCHRKRSHAPRASHLAAPPKQTPLHTAHHTDRPRRRSFTVQLILPPALPSSPRAALLLFRSRASSRAARLSPHTPDPRCRKPRGATDVKRNRAGDDLASPQDPATLRDVVRAAPERRQMGK
ncbi:uncharacterized protein BDZ99DRAFT_250776 [Mytilinidion resinicola]|uniref:Uncharacterized protein n=1 Tax=Mytilinidion resinicola TaxID=574789 RepID=A0A6A6YYS9_9PEZI|nr:uncharacterized protein BDZ99DRAFT_250776 [Mytilinidion resinicola]KAF2813154.1 hypothetical protein BDZ99DRAFT_250776 [Mytilinidion resinicola]